jgi:hypothetical protein
MMAFASAAPADRPLARPVRLLPRDKNNRVSDSGEGVTASALVRNSSAIGWFMTWPPIEISPNAYADGPGVRLRKARDAPDRN